MNMNEKCELLESLGFEIKHETSRVGHGGFEFDFSATNMEAADIIKVALMVAYKKGIDNGVIGTQQNIKSALGIK